MRYIAGNLRMRKNCPRNEVERNLANLLVSELSTFPYRATRALCFRFFLDAFRYQKHLPHAVLFCVALEITRCDIPGESEYPSDRKPQALTARETAALLRVSESWV